MLPETRFETNNPLTRKKWAKDLYRVVLPAVEFDTLMGEGKESIIQRSNDLAKGEGDEVTFGIRLPLSGEGRVGRDAVEGNEESLDFRDFKLTIEELNHAVDTGGKMEEQRVPYNLMEEAKSALQDWWGQKLSDFVINYLIGNSGYRVAGKVFAQAPVEPDELHFMLPDGVVSEAALDSSNVITLEFLRSLKQRAELLNNMGGFKIRPLVVGGKNYYRVLMHNYVFDQLKSNFNSGEWGDLCRSAGKLAIPQVEIEFDGMLIQKTERIPCTNELGLVNGGMSGAYRTVFLGAQAACFAWGGAGESKSTTMAFTPYERDAKRFAMVRGGGIFGMQKTRFMGKDFGIITAASYGAPLEN